MKKEITVTGIFHPLGWGCGFACDSYPTYWNPIIPAECPCPGGGGGGGDIPVDVMNYRGVFESLDSITFTPEYGDVVQIPDKKGHLVEYIYTGKEWDVFGEQLLLEGNGIDIDENTISVRVMDDTGVVNTPEGVGLQWSGFETQN